MLATRFLLSGLAMVVGLSLAMGQTTPPGGENYFGTAANQQFSPGSIFTPPNAAPPAPPPITIPANPPAGLGPDGGLLQPAPLPAPPPKIWSGGGEIGVNGASGNANLFNFRLGWNAQRKTESNIFTTDFLYNYARADNLVSVNQAILNARDEILFAGSPWSIFGATVFEYDELRLYDIRAGLYAGVGYTVVDDQTKTLKLRAGAGSVYETATRDPKDPQGRPLPRPDSRWVPELVFGYDFKYVLNERSSFLSILDYFPRVDDFTHYRLRVRAGYEYVLDPATGTVLRLGLQNRFDSEPGVNTKRNDLTYFATLGFKF